MTLLFEPFAPLLGYSRGAERRLAPRQAALRSFSPAADVVATEGEVTVTMDMPGLKAGDLEIELVDDVLTVRGERTYPYATDRKQARLWQHLERGYGAFERVLRVPKGLEEDSIRASMADGVLTLHIPVPQPPQPRRIAVNTNGGQPVLEHQETTGEHQESVGEEREMAGATA